MSCIPTTKEWAADIIGPHYDCDDPWYSCPLSETGCVNPDAGTECNCGRDNKIKKIVNAINFAVEEERRNCIHAACEARKWDGKTTPIPEQTILWDDAINKAIESIKARQKK